MSVPRVDSGEPEITGVVATALDFVVHQPSTLVLQVAVAGPTVPGETLEIRCNGIAVGVAVIAAPGRGRQHLVSVPAGALSVRYEAPVQVSATLGTPPVSAAARLEALRPSRYCPSDRVLGLAAAEFGHIRSADERIAAICDFVAVRTVYTAGSSGPTTDAIDTLLSGEGVCRDYAHAVAVLCRAAGVPARCVAVYAPGLSPMDLHAVVEAEVDGRWTVWDATRLAPRQSLVRIATGRDAADTAFVTVVDGRADLERLTVTAVAPDVLPHDDHRALVGLSLGG
jgi:transglutaminase-like putative cysteine protease